MTPSFFAFGLFFRLFLTIDTPRTAPARWPDPCAGKILGSRRRIRTETAIAEVVPAENTAKDARGNAYAIRPVDLGARPQDIVSVPQHGRSGTRWSGAKIGERRDLLLSKRGGESVFSLFVGVDEAPETFGSRGSEHVFYTPSRKGLGETHRGELEKDRQGFDRALEGGGPPVAGRILRAQYL